MNCKKITASVLLAALAAFSPTVSFAEDGQAADAAVIREKEATCYQYENGGFRLFVPKDYDDLLVTEIIKDRTGGLLYRVSEKASIEAVKNLPYDTRGAGWIFSIGQIDEGRRRGLVCGDMSGVDIFARDDQGQCFVYYHPTDVRYMRESSEAMQRDQKQWSMLNEWAWKSVRDEFCMANGLKAVSYDNSEVGIAIARSVYQPGLRYTVSTTEFGPIEAKGFDAVPFAERLIQNARYERTEGEAPDGEYVVLAFPDQGLRYDFFKMPGKENYVREVRQDGSETLYKAAFADDTVKASAVMQEWYNALAAQKKA